MGLKRCVGVVQVLKEDMSVTAVKGDDVLHGGRFTRVGQKDDDH